MTVWHSVMCEEPKAKMVKYAPSWSVAEQCWVDEWRTSSAEIGLDEWLELRRKQWRLMNGAPS